MTAKPPVAIRITRPYASEDDLLAAELDTISRTGVVLVGAQPRPEGVVLRFELALAAGTPLLRGEGRVIGYKPNVIGSEGGLALRFTRLDSKSKTLVDRVGALRDQRRSLAPPPPSAQRPSVPDPPAPPPELPTPPEPPPEQPPPEPTASSGEIPVSVESKPDLARPLAQAQDRSGMLARLRERAATISAERAAEIVAEGATRRRSSR